jgi:hypothetical protein
MNSILFIPPTPKDTACMGPTPKQKKYAKSLGIELYGDESRADVSELIEAAKLDRDTKRYGDASLDPMIGCVRCVPIIAVVCVFAGLSWNWFWALTIAAAFIVARPELWVMMVGTVAFGMWIPWYFDSRDWTPCWGGSICMVQCLHRIAGDEWRQGRTNSVAPLGRPVTQGVRRSKDYSAKA